MLPEIGYLRLHQIIGDPKRGIVPLIPVSRPTWWRGVKSGKYPAGVLHSRSMRLWDVREIRALLVTMGVTA